MPKRFCTLALGLLLVSQISQGRDLDQDEALELSRSGAILPLEQLLERALSSHPGSTLLEAELEVEDEGHVYEVELLTPDGIVRELELDARSGRLLKDEVDD